MLLASTQHIHMDCTAQVIYMHNLSKIISVTLLRLIYATSMVQQRSVGGREP